MDVVAKIMEFMIHGVRQLRWSIVRPPWRVGGEPGRVVKSVSDNSENVYDRPESLLLDLIHSAPSAFLADQNCNVRHTALTTLILGLN